MLEAVKLELTRTLAAVQVRAEDPPPAPDLKPHVENVQYQHPGLDEPLAQEPGQPAAAAPDKPLAPFVRRGEKIGRNDACPCGSGKKYKHCHGKLV